MNTWLQDFAYIITIPWRAFLIAGILAVLIALLTISFQAIRAAVNNPVKSLRTDNYPERVHPFKKNGHV